MGCIIVNASECFGSKKRILKCVAKMNAVAKEKGEKVRYEYDEKSTLIKIIKE